ncbi:glycogen debranching protein GlgX [Cohaesibacter celericrescens]|uniref:Glycogen debranching enzyme GlgX n=1 Tax=Cohaesibacter celericrescens TaxID=2067669 RepID=A0A2N5XVY0_9HYPH|nr:glycogen debranching protein GlgX [Cohaesibacter celericrescens]PLW78663.1 glycogen debranching enzyme GlgX [Cohaesibacter celericrescens]
MKYRISSGSSHQLGAFFDGEGTNFAVFSENASQIDLCFFSPDGKKEIDRVSLPERTGPVWHGYVDGVKPGALYGYRAHGIYAPEQGHRFNSNKLLLDPYTRELHGNWTPSATVFGYQKGAKGADLTFGAADSADCMPKSVVSDPRLNEFLQQEAPKFRDRDLIYEAHTKGLTKLHPGVPKALQGTYEGLASDAVIDHLLSLNVSAIELMPVHSFLDDEFLQNKGLRNYWGYNTIGFFALEPRYFGPEGIVGFRAMIQKLKAAGIKVYLDVVYNHTAEGDQNGPTLSFRGLDNASYYRLIAGQPRYYVNDTGCGNTVNVSHPFVLRMVLDSLRYWVQCMGVDGFRFDLATTVCREDHGFDPHGGFLDAIRQDPVLSQVKLIAEPWDIGPGGYRLGGFPPEFSEWNDGYRDTSRRYWKCDPQTTPDLASRLLGSADKFDRAGRRAWSSVNFVSSHDGFTLADISRYNNRHNLANGENNMDGHGANFSDNCGHEGDTDDPVVRARRHRRQRNLLATLFLSQGTPMLLAGDEIGNSQSGNNNAYCQDNDIGWVNWDQADTELNDFVTYLSAFRKAHKALRQDRFLHGAKREQDDQPDVEWTDFGGFPLRWRDPGMSSFCLTLRCSAEAPIYQQDNDVVFIIFNRSNVAADVVLPKHPKGYHWVRSLDTAQQVQYPSRETRKEATEVSGSSVVALILQPDNASS